MHIINFVYFSSNIFPVIYFKSKENPHKASFNVIVLFNIKFNPCL